VIFLGFPAKENGYHITDIDGIKVYHPSNIEPKQGYDHIRVKLKRFLFWSWLELEGTKSIAVFST